MTIFKRTWRCFHCDEIFSDREKAREHFGDDQLCHTACTINATEYRRMERYYQQCLAEDSDSDREFYTMQAAHAVALRHEEEKGYERGMRDMEKEIKGAK